MRLHLLSTSRQNNRAIALRIALGLALLITAALLMPMAHGQWIFGHSNLPVGDVNMPARNTLLQDLHASPVHTRFLQELRNSGVASQLGSAKYTVLAPTDDDYHALKGASADALEAPTQGALGSDVRYLVLTGKITTKSIRKQVKHGHGTALLKTLDGQTIKATMQGTLLLLTDPRGNTATIITPDVYCRDGILQVTDAVLLP